MKRSIQPDRLHHRIASLENLPTLPAVAVEMIRLWNEPDLSVREITELLSRDPSLSAKILQVANSSSLGLKKKVTSINHAAALLGLNALRCVTLGVTVFQCFSGHKADWTERMDLDEFWRHSIAVAVAAEMLAVRLGWPNPEEAFLAGLLHDIGKIGLLATIPQDYVNVVERASDAQKSLIEYESEELSVTHTEIGKRITERWGFPDILRNAIWLHHQPPPMGKMDSLDLPGLIYLADHMARRSRIGESGNHVFFHDDSWLMDKLRITEKELYEFTGNLLIRTQSVAEKLDLPLPTVEIYLKALEEANLKLSRNGLKADQENRRSLRTIEVLSTVSEIHQMRVQEDLEVDLLAKAVELIRQRFGLPWMVIMTHDTSLMTLEGVISSDHLGRTQTFYRSVDSFENHEEIGSMSRKGILDLLGETVLSSGKRINLRDEVCRVLENGQLSAIPIELDQVYRGECLVDTSGSKVVDAETRLSLDTAVEAAFALQERSRLYRRLQREAEDSAEAARRESEAMRQVFHVERLASIGRLAAGAAHEINNPLAVISGKAQILVMDETDQKRSKTLQDIIDQTERISKIISDLMGFARQAQPLVTDTNLLGLIEGALQMAHHRFPKSQVVPVVDVTPDLPTLRVDARQIEQVLVNLFVNAIQAMGERGTLTIRATHLKSTNMVSIQVTDNGPGIPGPDLPRIFDPFFTTKREGEGTGLGLAVCQRIIQTHGGHIWVTSHVGKGTTFTIQLPCGEAEEEVQVSRPKTVLPGKRPTRKRVLLVDDERSLSDLIRDFLTSAGYEVDQALDGEEGIRLLNENVYDGLVIDIRMPRKDGLEVLAEMQGTTPIVPALIITGLATNEEIDQAKDLGVNRVLRKPFQLDELLQAVREITKTT